MTITDERLREIEVRARLAHNGGAVGTTDYSNAITMAVGDREDLLAALRSEGLPPPESLVQYEDGSVCALMFHYLTEGMSTLDVARDQGFECCFRTMEHDLGDEHPLVIDYENGGVAWSQWNPTPPVGWSLGAKMDTEDGPYAMFIRKTE